MSVNFHIPDFINHFFLNFILISSLEEVPEYFRDDVRIASVFGNVCGSVWNGGRYLGGSSNMEGVKRIIEVLNEHHVPVRFTFTNPLLQKEHLGDHLCNSVLRMADNGMNEVIVMSPLLEEYIRKNYPNYKITSSTCKQIESIDGVNEELKKDYKYVVLDYNFNNRFETLEQIPAEERHRCEILVNACCRPNCPRRGEHYRQIGQEQINEWEFKRNHFNKGEYPFNDFKCDCMKLNLFEYSKNSTYVSPDDIYEKYLPMGFNNFKIEGRTTADIDMLETYVNYMAKPECRDLLRFRMLKILTRRTRFFHG